MSIRISITNNLLGLFLLLNIFIFSTQTHAQEADKTLPGTNIIVDSNGTNIKYNSLIKSGINLSGNALNLVEESNKFFLGFFADGVKDINIIDSSNVTGDNSTVSLFYKYDTKNTAASVKTISNGEVAEEVALKYKNKKGVDIDPNNIYMRSDGTVTEYFYDPTPNNVTNGDSRVIMSATKENLYISDPIDQVNNYSELTKFRNTIDVTEGRPSGTSEKSLTRIFSLKNEQEKINSDINTAQQQIDALEKELNNKNNDEATRAQIATSLEAARVAMSKLKNDKLNKDAEVAEATNRPTTGDELAKTLGCSGGVLSVFSLGCLQYFMAMIANISLKLTSFMAYLVGITFDYSLEFSINSAQFIKELGVVEVTWSFIRDILNITFIFILLYTAVMLLITNNEKSHNAKEVLIRVVIFAILINFSLFAAKLMVDASNIVSLKIYETMKVQGDGGSASISGRVMTTLGLSTIYSASDIFSTDKLLGCGNTAISIILISVLGSIFLIVMSLALGLAAILFFIRIVNIIMLFIKSPLWVWGYTLPGEPRMKKISSEWVKQMTHVMVFPIVYLFWMLIAIIIFSKLGEMRGGVTFLQLICRGNDSSIGQSASLIAIFVITITMMMKAIEYGVKHVGDGGGEMIGSKFGESISKRFAGYQTAMTRGLADKTNNLAMKGAKGTARLPLRAFTGTTGALAGGIRGTGIKEGFKAGFRNPSINTKENIGATARNLAARASGGLADKLTFGLIPSALAKTGEAWRDPKNSRGETQKEADKRRTKGAATDATNITKAVMDTYKVDTLDQFKKKNPSGTETGYETYVNGVIQKRADKLLGKGISSQTNAAGETHLKTLQKSIEKEMNTDGSIKSIKFNESKFNTELMNTIEHYTNGAGKDSNGSTGMLSKKKKGVMFRTKKGQAVVQATRDVVSKKQSEVRSKDAEKNNIDRLARLIDLQKQLPDKAKMDKHIDDAKPYKGYGEGVKDLKIKEINSKIKEISDAESSGTKTAAEIDKMKKDLKESSLLQEYTINKDTHISRTQQEYARATAPKDDKK